MRQKWYKRPFKRPVVKDRGGNMQMRWYVEYWYWSDAENGLVRARKSQLPGLPSPNRQKTAKARYRELNLLRDALELLLQRGWNPEKSQEPKTILEADNNPQPLTIAQAIAEALSIKQKEVGGKQYAAYKRYSASFLEHLGAKAEKLPDQITRTDVRAWLNAATENLSNRSRNTYLADLLSLWNLIIDEGHALGNPCRGIKKLPDKPETHVAFTPAQMRVIGQFLKKHDVSLYHFTLFIGYTYFRNSEILSLQRQNVDLQNGLIRLNRKSAKRQSSEIAPIIERLKPVVQRLSAECSSGQYYLFGKTGKPGPKPYRRTDALSEKWNRHRPKINLLLNKDEQLSEKHTLYGMRHTFIQDMYRTLRQSKTREQAEFEIMQYTRHKTVEALRKYIRDYNMELPKDWGGLYSIKY